MEEIEREQMDVDVLFVGAGPANLIGSWHLMQLINQHNKDIESGKKKGNTIPVDELIIAIIEKGSEVGAHNFSGAILDPIAISEAMPDFLEQGFPIEGKVERDAMVFLTETMHFKLPIIPPGQENHGNYVISLSKVCRWLGQKCEEAGIQIFAGFPGVKVIFDPDNRVAGVQTGDKGLDSDGHPKDNFEPGINLKAKVTVFGEGPRGNLFKQVDDKLSLQKGKNPQTFEMGVKEIFEVQPGRINPGDVWHTMGYPIKNHTFGGGFIYGMSENRLALGLVVDLHSPDPYLDAHRELQKLKAHPFVSELIDGGKIIQYGGKALPSGGYHSMPKLSMDGALVVGDSASMLNGVRLKGIHTAMKAGILAAETIFESMVKEDFSARHLETYEQKVKSSYIHSELYGVRNFHQLFDDGFFGGLIKAGMQMFLGLFNSDKETKEDNFRTKKVDDLYPSSNSATSLVKGIKYDSKKFLDKLTDAYLSGTKHEEKQPSHLRLSDPDKCALCWSIYRAPCTNFCPVKVYEMPEDVEEQVRDRMRSVNIGTEKHYARLAWEKGIPSPGDHDRGVHGGHGGVPGQQWPNQLLHINFTNCVHCKTCDIKCPFLNLTWTPPEGGGGPAYTLT